jgi:hypothetical protein
MWDISHTQGYSCFACNGQERCSHFEYLDESVIVELVYIENRKKTYLPVKVPKPDLVTVSFFRYCVYLFINIYLQEASLMALALRDMKKAPQWHLVHPHPQS